jgi:type II secretory pathway component PulM
MSTLATRAAALQDRLQDAVADMNPRDRNLLGGLVVFAFIVVLGGGYWWMDSTLSGIKSRLSDREDQLRMVQLLASDHLEGKTKAEEIRSTLERYQSQDFSSFMEQAAQKVGVSDKLSSVRRKSESTNNQLQELVYSVKLSDLQQDELVSMLYEVEASGYPVNVRSFKAKTRSRKGEKSINVDMEVATYKVLAAAEEEEG